MKGLKKLTAIIMCVALCFGVLSQLPFFYGINEVSADDGLVNVGVDINDGKDNRTSTRSTIFEDWSVASGQESTYEAGGLTFKLSNGSGKGSISGTSNRNLVVTEGESPVLTMDGVRLVSVFSAGVITLEISGLPAGEHTITTWHNFYYDPRASLKGGMDVAIDGKQVNDEVMATILNKGTSGLKDIDATILYNTFTAEEGKPVVISFSSEKDVPVLCAFEIDGVNPLKAISNTVPVDAEIHFDPAIGLSWTPAKDAKEHKLYLSDDKAVVDSAQEDTAGVFLGTLTETSYDLSDIEFDHMKTYYWRVDEVWEDGTTVKGKLRSFEVNHLAFPSAEGYGRYAKAGRGGQVIRVTSLEDNVEDPQPGTLRYALQVCTGPRVVIFDVGGIIELQDKLTISGGSGNVYIAGQTAPGDGITLTKYSLGLSGANDVVIRNIRVRVGDSNGAACDGMGMAGADNCIIDHCSIAWATDEGFSSRNANNVTFQWNIIGESLNNSVHYNAEDRTQTERHAFAGSISGDIGSFHHNLLVNCTGRNWSMAGGVGKDNKTYGGQLDIRNNVIYNFQGRTTDGGARRVNFVGNYYKMGAVSNDMDIFSIDGNELGYDDCQMAYLLANKLVSPSGEVLLDPEKDDPWKRASCLNKGGNSTDEECISYEPFFESYITEDTADDAYTKVIANAGANTPGWDYIDTRYIKEITEGSYTYRGSKDGLKGIIDSQEDVGGYPTEEQFKGGTAPVDTDLDGIPDSWETAHGLDPEKWSDGQSIYLSDEGYTNLEMYLNELAGDEVVYAENPVLVYEPEPTATPEPPATPEPTATPEPSDTPEPTGTDVPKASDTPIPSESSAPTVLYGDANGDTNIDAKDALAILKHAAKIEELTGAALEAADVDFNTKADAKDALEILKFVAKLRGPFVKPE